MTRPAIDPHRHARESLLAAIGDGMTDSEAQEYAVERLRGQGLPRAEVDRVVQAVWDERFKVWGV